MMRQLERVGQSYRAHLALGQFTQMGLTGFSLLGQFQAGGGRVEKEGDVDPSLAQQGRATGAFGCPTSVGPSAISDITKAILVLRTWYSRARAGNTRALRKE